MWIRTQGGYLLNLDRVDFIKLDSDVTVAYANGLAHVIGEGDLVSTVSGAIRCNTTILEVRDYVRN